MNEHLYLTPPQYAKRLGVTSHKVIRWIRNGELRAIDVSSNPGVGRPRFRINPADIIAFEQRRAVVVAPKVKRRRKQSDDVIQFF